jgi:RimJ/RimL family protein N-acetyltransferase
VIELTPFGPSDFDTLINWTDSAELLLTIAGDVFSYPLTHKQLATYLANEKSWAFNIVDPSRNKIIGHAELLLSPKDICKIDKLIIGDKDNRGRGIGQQVINKLLDYAFTNLDITTVELNVFDWNIAGIRCYEKCGFSMNPGKQSSFRVGDNNWIAFNMTISKNEWAKRKLAGEIQINKIKQDQSR